MKACHILYAFSFLCIFHAVAPISLMSADAPAVNSAKEPTKQKTFNSVEERRINAILQNERDNLADDKKVLDIREKELKTLQEEVDKKLEQIDKKIAELKQIQKKIDESLAKKDAEEVKKTKNLSLIYAKMAPAKAAMAMGTLSSRLASDLLANMKVKSAAKILDQMDKTRAAQLSITFSTIQME